MGSQSVATNATLGSYSERILIHLEEEHPELGKEFGTKYFIFKEPGLVMWGHNEQTFTIHKIVWF